MYGVDTTDTVGAKPTPSALGSEGWFRKADAATNTRGTVVPTDWANMVQLELLTILDDTGTAHSKTTAQISGIISGAYGVKAHATDTGVVDTYLNRVVIASEDSKASGVSSACIACDDASGMGGTASGEGSLAAASSGSGATGRNSAVIAAVGATAAAERCVVIASSGTCQIHADADDCALIATFSTSNIGANARRSAIIASDNTDLGDTANAFSAAAIASIDGELDGNRSALLATDGATLTGLVSAAIASLDARVGYVGGTGSQLVALASQDAEVEGDNSAVIASNNCRIVDEGADAPDEVAVIASLDADARGVDRAAIVACSATDLEDGAIMAAIGSQSGGVGNTSHAVLLGSINAIAEEQFVVAGGWAGSSPSFGSGSQNLTFKIETDNGKMYLDDATIGTPADYAECFENGDGDAHGVGELLGLHGATVKRAVEGDRVAGVVSARPSHVGNASPLGWQGRHRVDAWGRLEKVPSRFFVWAARYEGEGDERKRTRDAFSGFEHDLPSGVEIPDDARITGVELRVDADEYDPQRVYTPRTERPAEWSIVGLVGQVPVRVDTTVRSGDEVVPSTVAGVGTRRKQKRSKGREIVCLKVRTPYDEALGYAIASCLVG